MRKPMWSARLVALVAAAVVAGPAAAEGPVDFAAEIGPLLERRCLSCHHPDKRGGDVSLATAADLIDGGHVAAGDPDGSHLIALITATGGRAEMPKGGTPLSTDQVALLRRWIAEGADWPEAAVLRPHPAADASWWSLRPLHRDAAEGAADGGDPGEPVRLAAAVDRFIDESLAERGLHRNPPADRSALIRRATYDLLGLPPTPAEMAAFVADDDPKAYANLIDRLLASPHYGRRWGRHWLDVIRFGESVGFEQNYIVEDLWPLRDHVIASLNADLPLDRLIREHLAGDAIADADRQSRIATAFLVAGPHDSVGNQDAAQAAQIRANTIDEMIQATSAAFLGLTVGCARCHDHKFDPIPTRDYYAWHATFAGVRHGRRVLATAEQQAAREAVAGPLQTRRDDLTRQRNELAAAVLARGRSKLAEYERSWSRPPVDRQGTGETFAPSVARFVRLVSEGRDVNPADDRNFAIDEFEVWTAQAEPRNVALASAGSQASGASRSIEDFPGAYGPGKAIDGRFGERFLATGGSLTVQLAGPTRIGRIVFSSGRGEGRPEQGKFATVAEYRIEVSTDGDDWVRVADSHDRRPVSDAHRDHRLRRLETTAEERLELARLDREVAAANAKLQAVPPLPTVWIGTRSEQDAAGPFHVFRGGDPQRPGTPVSPSGLSALAASVGAEMTYELPPNAPEAQRRLRLAEWIVADVNPLSPRVLANRVWHHHFGTGIVDTPNDFGFMGGRPTHPELLDWLAVQLRRHDWRLKPLHRIVMLSQTYRQSAEHDAAAARIDGAARLLWRFPPRRLSAEEIRDTVLDVAGKLDRNADDGGPGFRLYQYLRDNVATYVPLDEHGPETYRRAVYHQNARAAPTDLMTDFDQPDCAFSAPKRSETTTPLQALTMLNHRFTLDMAAALAERLRREAGDDIDAQLRRAYALCHGREPTAAERAACRAMAEKHGLAALCRVLLNTSELIHVR